MSCTMSVPALAQAATEKAAEPRAQAQVTMKRVCTRVEGETGTRITKKVCRMVEVKAPASNPQKQPAGAGASN